ncbi:MAG: FecR domain-containing protein [Tannerella sp.]|jgi:ferric-dicitrate binding protein FerR (iron transport regulator)|nr:FecR domain-containing protein [Tannerella sp.]
MDKKTDIWVSISSVLEGEYTAEEKQSVDSWLLEDEKNQRFFDKIKNSSFSQDIEQRAHAAQERVYWETREKISRMQFKRKLRLWQYVAAASIAILLIVNAFNFRKTESVTPIYMESKSPIGSTSRLTLSDGTLVELNAGSSISYPLSFQGKNRTVTLNGEAYFEVAKDAKHPFVVEANEMQVEVLGTHFNVKSYEEDQRMVTTLMEGSVNVKIEYAHSPSDPQVILKPDQQIVFDKTTNKTEVSNVNAGLYASWKNGECFFENEKFIDIAKILGRQYGVRITILSPNLENQLYSGYFNKQEGLFHILNSFKKYRNFEYQQTDTGIEIYERE